VVVAVVVVVDVDVAVAGLVVSWGMAEASSPSGKGYWAHETAIVDQPARIGDGTRIWHFCHVMAGARIGARCVLGQNVFVAARAVMGDGCKIQNNVSLYDDVELADDVFVAPSAVFTNVINPRAFIERKHQYLTTRVGRGASIGANATVVCGHAIGEYAFVGAGAVVTRDVPAHGLVTGVPARQVGWMCRCGVRLPSGPSPKCGACGQGYVESRAADGSKALTPESS
jgi:UDP-2-acetamido-3-amino-2,3-dideoxy-glucuronate N-acetyltransferase